MYNPGEDLNMEFSESRSRSFTQLWGVADDYVLQDGKIKPIIDGEVCNVGYSRNEYFPMGRTELPGEFAKVASGKEEDVLAFFRKYGMLKGNIPISFKKDDSAWSEKVARGNPLGWVITHAKAVQLVMELSDALDKPSKLKDMIQRLTVVLPGMNEPEIRFTIPRKSLETNTWTKAGQLFEPEPKSAALFIISSIINENIRTVSRCLQVENQSIVSLFTTHDLLDCIYWLLADAVVSGRVKTCEECGSPFVADNEKRRFCPPTPHEEISRCMNRAKQKRHRSKQKSSI